MNRAAFVKSMLTITGTAFISSCKEAESLVITPGDAISPVPDLDYSRTWFSDTYIPQFDSGSARTVATSVDRTLDWSSSIQVHKEKENFIWVPVKYDSEHIFPRLVTWKEGQEYIPKLAQYLSWMIAEGFIIWRNAEGNYQGFLAQVAYDPFKHKSGQYIDSRHFTGMIVHAAWNESPLRVWRFLDGALESSFDSERKSGARMRQCSTFYYSYNSATTQNCGPNCISVDMVIHQGAYTYCDDGSGSGTSSGSQSYPYYGGGGSGGYTTPPSSGGPPPFQGYNFNKVAAQDGSQDYQIFMQRLNTILNNFNIPATTFGLSLTYADTMVKALGIEGAGFFSLGTRNVSLAGITRAVGVVGVAVGASTIVINYIDQGYLTETDWLNMGAVGLGVISAFTPIGWLALGAGMASAAISFYASSAAPHSLLLPVLID